MNDSDEGTRQSRFPRRSRRLFLQSASAVGLGLTTGTSIATALENETEEHDAGNGDADTSEDSDTIEINYHQCRAAVVTNASDIDALAVYYADRQDERQAIYDIDPTTADSREYEPLVVEHDAHNDQTRVQLAGSEWSLVCVTAEAAGERTTVSTRPTPVSRPGSIPDTRQQASQ